MKNWTMQEQCNVCLDIDIFAEIYFSRIRFSREYCENKSLAKIN